MRFVHAAVLLSVLCAFAGVAATTPTRTTAVKKVTTKKATTGTVKKATSKTVVSTSAKSKLAGKKAPPAANWRTRQMNPTPERYKEIQQALVDKGYLKGEPSGVWDNDSVAALQHFQTDQKMTATGKINASSLIGLGLGAKSAGAPEAPPLAPETPALNPPPPASPQ